MQLGDGGTSGSPSPLPGVVRLGSSRTKRSQHLLALIRRHARPAVGDHEGGRLGRAVEPELDAAAAGARI